MEPSKIPSLNPKVNLSKVLDIEGDLLEQARWAAQQNYLPYFQLLAEFVRDNRKEIEWLKHKAKPQAYSLSDTPILTELKKFVISPNEGQVIFPTEFFTYDSTKFQVEESLVDRKINISHGQKDATVYRVNKRMSFYNVLCLFTSDIPSLSLSLANIESMCRTQALFIKESLDPQGCIYFLAHDNDKHFILMMRLANSGVFLETFTLQEIETELSYGDYVVVLDLK